MVPDEEPAVGMGCGAGLNRADLLLRRVRLGPSVGIAKSLAAGTDSFPRDDWRQIGNAASPCWTRASNSPYCDERSYEHDRQKFQC